MSSIQLATAEWRELNAALWARDGGCVAPLIDPNCGPCTDLWGTPYPRDTEAIITREHVRDRDKGPQRPHDLLHLVLACKGHHLRLVKGTTWCMSHKAQERLYLAKFAVTA